MSEVIVSKKVGEYVPQNRWIASLSNGETIFEDNLPSLQSSWNRLAAYIKANKLAITALRVQIGGGEVTLPTNQEGYVQKKRAMATQSWATVAHCIGYVQGSLSLIHYLGSDMSSETKIEPDPGVPFTIYRHDKGECTRPCCVL